MNSVEETRLAEDLRLLAASPADPPDLGQIERRGAQRRRRGYVSRGLAALSGLAVAAGTGLTVISAGGGAPAETAGYVTQRITATLTLNNLVIESRNSGASSAGPVTYWTDLRTGDAVSVQGRGATRTAFWLQKHLDRQHQVLHTTVTQVNYGPRTWWTVAQQFAVPPHGGVGVQGPGQVTDYTPQFIADLLKDKTAIVGHPYVDGRRTVELSAGGAGPKILLWADASTYQVVRMEVDRGVHTKPMVVTFTWTRRTAALVQRIDHPQIPAGFRQVPPRS